MLSLKRERGNQREVVRNKVAGIMVQRDRIMAVGTQDAVAAVVITVLGEMAAAVVELVVLVEEEEEVEVDQEEKSRMIQWREKRLQLGH